MQLTVAVFQCRLYSLQPFFSVISVSKAESRSPKEGDTEMIMADKIIELRKKNGWSQEELADKLDVSRQSISKWEGAQSIPDMKRIIQMSEIFGVSTDFLLKDEMGLESIGPKSGTANQIIEEKSLASDNELEVKTVTMEEASAFLDEKDKASRRISLGVMLCIMSPIVMIALAGLSEAGMLALTEAMALGAGLVVLFILICIAVALFVTTDLSGNRFEYMEKSAIETAYGVDGMVKSRKEHFADAYMKMVVSGIILCVGSVLPLFITMMVFGEGNGNGSVTDELPYMFAVCVLLLMVSLGVFLIVRASVIQGGYQMLLEEGDYTRENKAALKRNQNVITGYWIIVTAVYLGYSFITNNWSMSWVIWPVAGVLYGLVIIIANTLRKKN